MSPSTGTSLIPRINQKEVHVTPPGIADYLFVVKPRIHQTYGANYSVGISFSPKEEAEFLSKMEGILAIAIESERIKKAVTTIKRADPPWGEDENSGKRIFRFKLKAEGLRDDGTTWTATPPGLFDSKGQELALDPTFNPGAGSLIKVFFCVRTYCVKNEAGISLRLRGIQILHYVPHSLAAQLGVKDESDGSSYVADMHHPDIVSKLSEREPKAEPFHGATDDDIPY